MSQGYGGQGGGYGSRMGAPMAPFQPKGFQPEYRLGGGAPRYGPSGDPNAVNLTGFGPQMAPESQSRTMQAPVPYGGPSMGPTNAFNGNLAQQSDQNMAQFTPGFFGQQSSAPGRMVNQRMAPQQSAPPQQSFEQFQQTLGNNGMTSGQMQDAYQKSLQPASTNFWGNVGPGGTQNPFPQTPNWTPEQWGKQTFGFDPRAMAGKQVTGDLGWYYGRDAIGRTINNAGDAVPSFGAPADGLGGRVRPWQRG